MEKQEAKFEEERAYWYFDDMSSNEIFASNAQLDGYFTISDLIRIAEKMKKLEGDPRPGSSHSDIPTKSLRNLMSLYHLST